MAGIRIHVVDGTYELFRHFFGAPPATDKQGREIGAVRGVVGSILGMLEDGATHLGVATDHVVESFRNDMYPGYKTGEGIEPVLMNQFHPLEDALRALGVRVWPMIDQEADDAMAAAAARASEDPAVERIFLCTPDKDLGQCVRGDRVVQFDRRAGVIRNADGVREKFGVDPESIPDYLGLVGDSADGFPGVPGWGAKSAGTVLGVYKTLEKIPQDRAWRMKVRGAARLTESLTDHWNDALLFRELARLRTDHPVFDTVEDLRWRGPRKEFAVWAEQAGTPGLARRAAALAETR